MKACGQVGRSFARWIAAAAMAAAMVLPGGCIETRQPPLKVDIYTPVYAPPAAAPGPALPAILRVERFSVAPDLNTVRMAYRTGPHRIDYYHYHQWQANPADVVTYFLARDLRASSRFAGVATPGSAVTPTHRVEGVVDGFHEVDEGDGQWYAEAAVSITLVRDREPDVSRRVLFQKAYRHRERLEERSPGGAAAGMSRCLAVISAQVAADLSERLAASAGD